MKNRKTPFLVIPFSILFLLVGCKYPTAPLNQAGNTTYSVSPSGVNVSISPNSVQTVAAGAQLSFIVSALKGYKLSAAVGGNCTAGVWNGNNYTTGAISTNCSVVFSATLAAPTLTSVSPTYAIPRGGVTVTLTGTGFFGGGTGGNTSINVGKVPCANVVVTSDSQATCTVGAHAPGAVDVTLQNGNPTPATLSNGFTYQHLLYTDNSVGNNEATNVYLVSPTSGIPTLISPTPATASGGLDPFLAINPVYSFMYGWFVGGFGDAYPINPLTGSNSTLSSNFSVPALSGLGASDPILFSSDGNYAFLASGYAGEVYAMQVNSTTGALSSLNEVATAFKGVFPSLVLSPNGQFLYVSDNGQTMTFAFQIDPNTHELTSIGSYNVGGPAVVSPQNIIYFPSSPGVRAFSIGSTGGLTELPDSPYATTLTPALTSASPNLAINASGNALLIITSTQIVSLPINNNGISGTAPTTIPLANNNPSALVMDPERNFAYVQEPTSLSVEIFSTLTGLTATTNGPIVLAPSYTSPFLFY